MAKDDGVGAGAVFLAFLAGAVAGAAVALLYAPAAGEETREYLGQRAREGRDKVAEFKREMSRAPQEREQES
jgi:gas vesicle protein